MNFQYVLSIIKLDRLCSQEGIDIDYSFIAHESLIPRGRNYLCDNFLKSKCTHLLFIDADIQFEAEDIVRMIRKDVPLIGGVYPKKKLHWDRIHGRVSTMARLLDYVVTPISDTDVIENIYEPFPVRYVGTGLMLIQRQVLEKMKAAFPMRMYYAEGKPYQLFFDCVIKDGQYLSEDYYFCDVWREMGGTVYAAYWTRTTHWGLMNYDGNILAMS